MKKAVLLASVVLCFAMGFLSCTNDNSTSPGKSSSKTETILGLDQNHTNLYQKFDSLATYTPNYQLILDTSLVTFTVIDVDSDQTKFDIAVSSEKLARLIITSNSVAMTGYYQKILEHDSLFYFINPPVVMPIHLTQDDSWQFFVPPLHRDGKELITSFLNFGFGYDVKRTYLGRETIIVPAGAYDAHIIQTDYLIPGSAEIVKTDIEYLVEGIGLVRLYSNGHFGTTHIFLIETDL